MQLVEIDRVPIFEQIFPLVQGENVNSEEDVVGFMMYCPLALQAVVEAGQQYAERVQPLVH